MNIKLYPLHKDDDDAIVSANATDRSNKMYVKYLTL